MSRLLRLPGAPVLLLAGSLALAGCGGDGGGGRTPGEGRYKITVKLTKFDVPGLDAPKLHAMQRDVIGKESTTTYCLSPADAAKKAEILFERIGEGACHLHDFDPKGGKVDVLMTCRALSGRQSYHLKGSLSGRGAHVIAEGVVTNRRFPKQQATISKDVTMKRIADCAPPAPKKKTDKKDKG